jgi:DedD protein
MAESRTEELQEATEITLGTGKLLGIFFGIAFLCAVFFSFGYMVGHGSSSAGKPDGAANAAPGNGPGGKPSASNKTPTGPSLAPAPPRDTPAPALVPPAASQPSGDKTNAAGGTYMVQVAAVSKREDADILVSALQKRQYPAFVASASGDALFHVQVGPFNDADAAESMRSRLAADGYNAIVKK